MKPEKIAQLRAYVALAARLSAERLADLQGARFAFRGGAYEMRLAGLAGTSTMSRDGAKESWIRAARRKLGQAEANCLGHLASKADPKTCDRCGVHVDELRPPDDAELIDGLDPIYGEG